MGRNKLAEGQFIALESNGLRPFDEEQAALRAACVVRTTGRRPVVLLAREDCRRPKAAAGRFGLLVMFDYENHPRDGEAITRVVFHSQTLQKSRSIALGWPSASSAQIKTSPLHHREILVLKSRPPGRQDRSEGPR